MSRYERGQFFEALCGLRDAYEGRSDDDRRSSLLINDAVVYAEAVMLALDEKETAADLVEDASMPTEPIESSDPSEPMTTGETSG
jgi:hypothetical protein